MRFRGTLFEPGSSIGIRRDALCPIDVDGLLAMVHTSMSSRSAQLTGLTR